MPTPNDPGSALKSEKSDGGHKSGHEPGKEGGAGPAGSPPLQALIGNHAVGNVLNPDAPGPPAGQALRPGDVLALQQTAGNQAVAKLLEGGEGPAGQPQDAAAGGDKPDKYHQPGKYDRNETGPWQGEGNTDPAAKQRAKARIGKIRGLLGQAHEMNKRDVMGMTRGDALENEKTQTAGGAFLASQMGYKDKIGDVSQYMTPSQRTGHLKEFLEGAHAFVSDAAYAKIRGQHLTEPNFNAWGAGSNFVAPLADADKLVRAAAAPGGRGIFQLEKELGIPTRRWVNECKAANYGIWRFKILKPEALNLRIPSGSENGAYASWVDNKVTSDDPKEWLHKGEWRPGGKTLGGAKEAVIDQIGAGKFGEKGDQAGLATRTKLADLVKEGVLKIELDMSMAANTLRVLEQEYGEKPPVAPPVVPAPQPSSSGDAGTPAQVPAQQPPAGGTAPAGSS